MSLRKIIWVSIGLSALFFFIGWVFTPAIMDFVIGYMKSVSKNLEVVSNSMSAQFHIHLYSSLSLAAIPLLGLVGFLFIILVRKKSLTSWDYFFNLSILVVVYFVASVFKFYALEATIVKVLNNPVSSNIKNTLPIDQVLLYDWSFYGTLIAAFFISILAKRKVRK